MERSHWSQVARVALVPKRHARWPRRARRSSLATCSPIAYARRPAKSRARGGVTLFTKSAALSFAGKGWKIRVNSIHPSVIDTDMGSQVFVARASRVGEDVERARNAAMKLHPIGRFGVAEDVALAIVFLASDDAGFTTGSAMVVDGGLTA